MLITNGQSNLTKGRIADTYGQYSLLFNGPPLQPSKLPLSTGLWTPIYYMVHWAQLNLNWFSHFLQGSQWWQTERHATLQQKAASMYVVLRCGLITA